MFYYKIPLSIIPIESDMVLLLHSVFGFTNIYVNPLIKPLELNKYQIKSEGPMSKRLTLDPSSFTKEQIKNEFVYVAIKAGVSGEFFL